MVTPWISAEILHLFDARQSLPFGSEYNEAHPVTSLESSASLLRDCQIL